MRKRWERHKSQYRSYLIASLFVHYKLVRFSKKTDLVDIFFEVLNADVEDHVSGADDQGRPVSPKKLEVIAVRQVPGIAVDQT